ncbi:unnamed protein product [Diamesa hyperborea]
MSYGIDVKYEFIIDTATPGYFCITVDLVITKPGVKITNFNGVHKFGMTDGDVLQFNTTKQNADYLPHGLAEKFVNLESLYVIESGLKAITRSDFKSLTKLKEIALYGNQIDEIPANCFDNLMNLKKLSLSNNRIKYLPNEVFHQLPNLVEVYISRNNLEALPSNLFENNPQMLQISLRDNILKSIGDGIIINLKELIAVSLEDNTCISDNFPKSSLETLSKNIKDHCSVEDLCLHTRIEINSEVQKLTRKLEQCENDKTEQEILQLSLMTSISSHEQTKHEDKKKLQFLEAENLYLLDENEHYKHNDETALNDLQAVISSLKKDLMILENSSSKDKSKLEEQIITLTDVKMKQEETEINLRSENKELKQQIQNLQSEVGAKKPINLDGEFEVDNKKMELAYKVLMFAIDKFKENDQNKPSSASNDGTNVKRSQIELIFHHKG